MNCIITFVVIFLQQQGIDLTFKDNGHKFMSVLVSFLVVSRNSIVYSRYMEARSYLGSLFRASSELVQNAAVITQNDQSKGIKEWRTEVQYVQMCLSVIFERLGKSYLFIINCSVAS